LLLSAGLVATSGGLTTGCGPSFQAVYECDVRFEHCYALDQGPAGSTEAMKACWRDWLHGYTYGQPSDRVEYAATRFSELSLDPTLPSVDTDARPKRRTAAPMPTNAFAPPPNLESDGHGDGASTPPQAHSAIVAAATPLPAAPVSAQQSAQAPGEQCTAACAERWNGCRKGCADGACDSCDRAYKSCVPGCFQDVRQAPRSLR
jgi:hypothetical protein